MAVKLPTRLPSEIIMAPVTPSCTATASYDSFLDSESHSESQSTESLGALSHGKADNSSFSKVGATANFATKPVIVLRTGLEYPRCTSLTKASRRGAMSLPQSYEGSDKTVVYAFPNSLCYQFGFVEYLRCRANYMPNSFAALWSASSSYNHEHPSEFRHRKYNAIDFLNMTMTLDLLAGEGSNTHGRSEYEWGLQTFENGGTWEHSRTLGYSYDWSQYGNASGYVRASIKSNIIMLDSSNADSPNFTSKPPYTFWLYSHFIIDSFDLYIRGKETGVMDVTSTVNGNSASGSSQIPSRDSNIRYTVDGYYGSESLLGKFNNFTPVNGSWYSTEWPQIPSVIMTPLPPAVFYNLAKRPRDVQANLAVRRFCMQTFASITHKARVDFTYFTQRQANTSAANSSSSSRDDGARTVKIEAEFGGFDYHSAEGFLHP